MSQHTPDLNKSASNASSNRGVPLIPMSRIRTIMKSSPEITNINQDTLYSVCKATVCINQNNYLNLASLFLSISLSSTFIQELFIQMVTKEAFKKTNNKELELNYDNLANLVTKEERFQFLSGN